MGSWRSFVRRFLCLGALLSPGLLAGQNYYTGTVYSTVLKINDGPPQCAETWYDPEILVYPNGDLGLLAQGDLYSCGTYSLDQIWGARRDAMSGVWTTPSTSTMSCPVVKGPAEA